MDARMREIETIAKQFVNSKQIDLEFQQLFAMYKISVLDERRDVRTYGPSLDAYKDMLKIVKSFLNRVISSDDILTICGALSYLMWEGYLSYNEEFRYTTNTSKLLDVMGYLGVDVTMGYGCCRHLSEFLNDMLHELQFVSETVANNEYLSKNSLTLPIKMKSEKGIIKKRLFSRYNNDNKQIGNHMCNVFSYGANHVMYDPTNILLFLMDGIKGDMLFGKGTAIVEPKSLIACNGMFKDDVVEYIQSLSLLEPLTKKETKELYNKLLCGVNVLKSNPEECKQLSKSIKGQVDYIYNYTRRIK